MLLSDNKNKLVTTLVGKMNSKDMEEKPMEDGAEQDNSMAETSAAEEIIQALKSENAAALKEALKSFMEICSYEKED